MSERAARMHGLELFEPRCAKSDRPLRSAIAEELPWLVWHRSVYEQHHSG